MNISDQATLALYNRKPIPKTKEPFEQKIKCPDYDIVQPLSKCEFCEDKCGCYRQLSAILNNK